MEDRRAKHDQWKTLVRGTSVADPRTVNGDTATEKSYRLGVDFLCPVDGARVKVVEGQRAPEAGPLVRCPECGKYFLFTSAGALDEVTEPE